ncbi:MAG: AMP-binding protein [Burkholderiales bacterium]|nr:AMP-binding protein [Burkholderiales bacterium]
MTRLLNLADAVAAHARFTPTKLGARDSRRSLSYAEWHERATRLAAGLLASGLARGDRVGVLAYNCLEWLEIYVALARAGLVAVPVNFRLAGPEVAYILTHAEVGAVIAGAEFTATLDAIRGDLPQAAAQRCIVIGQAQAHWTGYEAVIREADPGWDFAPVGQEEQCALMYTSGTTGRPKGAIRSHGGSSLLAFATALEMGFTRDDTGLLVMPLCHANSLYFATTFIHLGATCIVDDSRHFDPERLLATLSREKVTFTSLVPTHYIMVLALPDEVKRRYDVGSVGKLLVSSAPVRRDTKLAILEFFRNGKLHELYGSTEHGWVTLLRPHEQIDKLGSVGREWAGSGAIRILDGHGREVPDGEAGELYSRTPYVFDGYWRDPEKTAEAFRGDWCTVGDMARRDADGYIWLVDRKSNMIISGGENVYPSEVEGVLGAHPKVKDVAVIGVPHEKWGEAVQAVIVLHEGEAATSEEIRAWCRQRLAGFKCPTSVTFLADSAMPRTATGKILHRVLRQRATGAA